MRYKINKIYYFKIEDKANKRMLFGMFRKASRIIMYDRTSKKKEHIRLQFRAKCYNSKPILYPSKKNPGTYLGYYEMFTMPKPDSSVTIITSKEFWTLYSLFGPKNEKNASSF